MSRFVCGTLLALTLGFGACAQFKEDVVVTEPLKECEKARLAGAGIPEGEKVEGCVSRQKPGVPASDYSAPQAVRPGTGVAEANPSVDTTIPAAVLSDTKTNS